MDWEPLRPLREFFMARFLAAIGLAIAGAIPFSAGALGLGEIDLQSALNQPFSAEIPVVSETPGDLNALRIDIAPTETFKQFGLDRPAFLSDFSITVVGGESENAAIVQISSQQAIVEPFVTLLIEVSWPQGRLLREYTVLLDPPVYATESVEAAVTAPTAATTIPITQTAPTSVRSGGGAPSGASRSSSVASEGGVYGPVKRKETLWEIAGAMLGDTTSVSRNQMMLAIYQANPEAFNGNINRLKAGMILRLPSAGEVVLGSRDATAEVRRQNEQWRNEKGRSDESQGGRLRLVPPPDTDSDMGTADQVAQADSAGEDRPAPGTADRDTLQSRVGELENQLDESQRLLQIRDQELEALQRQLSGQQQESSQPEASEFPADVLAPEPDVEVQPGEAAEAPAVDTVTEGEETAPPVDVTPVDVTPVQAERAEESFLGALFTNPLVYVSLAIVLLLAWLFVRKRSAADADADDDWDALDEDGDMQEIHEATTLLEAQPLQDDGFVVEEASSTPDEATEDGQGISSISEDTSDDWGGLIDEIETPLERTVSTDSAVNLDQADPIAESDFHMAYGLYDQAADLLTKAIQIEPERKELRLKLLEVFFIWENQAGFLREAQALQQQLDGAADPDWNKVLIMGKQICPDEDLFAGEAAPVSMSENVDLEFGDEGVPDSIDFKLDDADASSIDLDFEDAGENLDFDMAGEQGSDDDSDAGLVDFEIGSEDEATQLADDDLTVESPLLDSTMESPTIISPVLDSTMESPTIESPVGQWGDDDSDDSEDSEDSDDSADAGSEQTAQIELVDLDIDLSGLNEISEHSMIDEVPVIDGDAAADTPDLDDDFMLDVGEPVIDAALATVIGDGDSVVDGATLTEVGTKLDLARAYIDMGDPDGARSILNEVIEESDSEQQQVAQKLLDEIVD
jgi:pilus assembly protein FimV